MRSLAPAVLSLLLLAAGCDGASDDASDETRLGPPELVLEIASPHDGDRDWFGTVTDVDVDASGRVLVLDGLARRVTVFDPAGAPVLSFGREGEGPGELIEPTGVMAGSDGTILVHDLGGQRLMRFSGQGEHLATVGWENAVVTDADGTATGDIVVRFRRGTMADLFAQEELGEEQLGRADPTDGIVTPLVPVPQNRQFEDGVLAAFPLWALAPDGRLIVTTSTADTIDVRSRVGDVGLKLGVARPTRAITEGEKEAIRQNFHAYLVEQGLPEQVADGVAGEDNFTVAAYYPLRTAVVFGPRQTIWLQRPVPVEGPADLDALLTWDRDQGIAGGAWDVYAADGEALGRVEFPGGFEPTAARGDRLYGIHTDELDVQTVRAYRVGRR